jgi:hypothetical protein
MLPVAEHLIGNSRQLGPVPQYASPEWPALPVGSPRWLAAVLGAAEAWRTWTDPAEVAWRLRVEIDAAGRDDDQAGARSHAPARHIGMSPRRGPRTRTVAIEVGRRSAWITVTSVASILDELRAPRMWCPFHRCPTIPVDYVGDLLAVLEYRDRRWVTVTAVDR